MTTSNTPTGQGPPTKRLTVTSKINGYRPKLFATLAEEGVWAWNKYDKCPRLISRAEIEAFFAECKAWAEQHQAGRDETPEEGTEASD